MKKRFLMAILLHRTLVVLVPVIVIALQGNLHAAKRCDWHSERASNGEAIYKKCIDLAATEGKTFTLPGNVTRISEDAFAMCKNAFFYEAGGEADIVYLMDNSGSMWTGEKTQANPIDGKPYASCAGDPLSQRDDVIKEAMDLQSTLGSRTSAGFIPFEASDIIQTDWQQSPISLSGTNGIANLTTIKEKVQTGTSQGKDPCESKRDQLRKQSAVAATSWGNSLKKVIEWKNSDPLFKASPNRAVILISDGAISDWPQVQTLMKDLPPVYGIHLGYRLNSDGQPDIASQLLETLAKQTGGQFFRVDPDKPEELRKVMNAIIKKVTSNPLPQKVEVSNASNNQKGIAVALTPNPDSSLAVKLDSIVALNPGKNNITVSVTLNNGEVRKFNFVLDASASDATKSAGTYTCYDAATLTMLDASGESLQIYGGGVTSYKVRLTRSPSTLNKIIVTAISLDSSKGATWGDQEAIGLGAPNMDLGYPVHTVDQPFDGRSDAPKKGNGKLESDERGKVILTWTNPRDARETATYTLFGKIIPIVDGVTEAVFLLPEKIAPKIPPPNNYTSNPIVIRDTLGVCVHNCVAQENAPLKSAPTLKLQVTAPFEYNLAIFDNLGHYVNSAKGQVTTTEFAALRKNADTATVLLNISPFSSEGQAMGTGVYILQGELISDGTQLSRNAKGDEVRVGNERRKILKRFGHIRH